MGRVFGFLPDSDEKTLEDMLKAYQALLALKNQNNTQNDVYIAQESQRIQMLQVELCQIYGIRFNKKIAPFLRKIEGNTGFYADSSEMRKLVNEFLTGGVENLRKSIIIASPPDIPVPNNRTERRKSSYQKLSAIPESPKPEDRLPTILSDIIKSIEAQRIDIIPEKPGTPLEMLIEAYLRYELFSNRELFTSEYAHLGFDEEFFWTEIENYVINTFGKPDGLGLRMVKNHMTHLTQEQKDLFMDEIGEALTLKRREIPRSDISWSQQVVDKMQSEHKKYQQTQKKTEKRREAFTSNLSSGEYRQDSSSLPQNPVLNQSSAEVSTTTDITTTNTSQKKKESKQPSSSAFLKRYQESQLNKSNIATTPTPVLTQTQPPAEVVATTISNPKQPKRNSSQFVQRALNMQQVTLQKKEEPAIVTPLIITPEMLDQLPPANQEIDRLTLIRLKIEHQNPLLLQTKIDQLGHQQQLEATNEKNRLMQEELEKQRKGLLTNHWNDVCTHSSLTDQYRLNTHTNNNISIHAVLLQLLRKYALLTEEQRTGMVQLTKENIVLLNDWHYCLKTACDYKESFESYISALADDEANPKPKNVQALRQQTAKKNILAAVGKEGEITQIANTIFPLMEQDLGRIQGDWDLVQAAKKEREKALLLAGFQSNKLETAPSTVDHTSMTAEVSTPTVITATNTSTSQKKKELINKSDIASTAIPVMQASNSEKNKDSLDKQPETTSYKSSIRPISRANTTQNPKTSTETKTNGETLLKYCSSLEQRLENEKKELKILRKTPNQSHKIDEINNYYKKIKDEYLPFLKSIKIDLFDDSNFLLSNLDQRSSAEQKMFQEINNFLNELPEKRRQMKNLIEDSNQFPAEELRVDLLEDDEDEQDLLKKPSIDNSLESSSLLLKMTTTKNEKKSRFTLSSLVSGVASGFQKLSSGNNKSEDIEFTNILTVSPNPNPSEKNSTQNSSMNAPTVEALNTRWNDINRFIVRIKNENKTQENRVGSSLEEQKAKIRKIRSRDANLDADLNEYFSVETKAITASSGRVKAAIEAIENKITANKAFSTLVSKRGVRFAPKKDESKIIEESSQRLREVEMLMNPENDVPFESEKKKVNEILASIKEKNAETFVAWKEARDREKTNENQRKEEITNLSNHWKTLTASLSENEQKIEPLQKKIAALRTLEMQTKQSVEESPLANSELFQQLSLRLISLHTELKEHEENLQKRINQMQTIQNYKIAFEQTIKGGALPDRDTTRLLWNNYNSANRENNDVTTSLSKLDGKFSKISDAFQKIEAAVDEFEEEELKRLQKVEIISPPSSIKQEVVADLTGGNNSSPNISPIKKIPEKSEIDNNEWKEIQIQLDYAIEQLAQLNKNLRSKFNELSARKTEIFDNCYEPNELTGDKGTAITQEVADFLQESQFELLRIDVSNKWLKAKDINNTKNIQEGKEFLQNFDDYLNSQKSRIETALKQVDENIQKPWPEYEKKLNYVNNQLPLLWTIMDKKLAEKIAVVDETLKLATLSFEELQLMQEMLAELDDLDDFSSQKKECVEKLKEVDMDLRSVINALKKEKIKISFTQRKDNLDLEIDKKGLGIAQINKAISLYKAAEELMARNDDVFISAEKKKLDEIQQSINSIDKKIKNIKQEIEQENEDTKKIEELKEQLANYSSDEDDDSIATQSDISEELQEKDEIISEPDINDFINADFNEDDLEEEEIKRKQDEQKIEWGNRVEIATQAWNKIIAALEEMKTGMQNKKQWIERHSNLFDSSVSVRQEFENLSKEIQVLKAMAETEKSNLTYSGMSHEVLAEKEKTLETGNHSLQRLTAQSGMMHEDLDNIILKIQEATVKAKAEEDEQKKQRLEENIKDWIENWTALRNKLGPMAGRIEDQRTDLLDVTMAIEDCITMLQQHNPGEEIDDFSGEKEKLKRLVDVLNVLLAEIDDLHIAKAQQEMDYFQQALNKDVSLMEGINWHQESRSFNESEIFYQQLDKNSIWTQCQETISRINEKIAINYATQVQQTQLTTAETLRQEAEAEANKLIEMQRALKMAHEENERSHGLKKQLLGSLLERYDTIDSDPKFASVRKNLLLSLNSSMKDIQAVMDIIDDHLTHLDSRIKKINSFIEKGKTSLQDVIDNSNPDTLINNLMQNASELSREITSIQNEDDVLNIKKTDSSGIQEAFQRVMAQALEDNKENEPIVKIHQHMIELLNNGDENALFIDHQLQELTQKMDEDNKEKENAKREEARQANQELLNELNLVKSEAEAIKRQKEDEQDRLQQEMHQLQELMQKMDEDSKEKENAKREEAKNEQDLMRQEMQFMREQLSLLTDRNKNLEAALNEAKIRDTEKTRQIQLLETQISDELNTVVRAAASPLPSEENQSLRQENTDLKEQIQDLQIIVNNVKKQNQSLQNINKILDEQNEVLDEQNDKLQLDLETEKELQVEALKAQQAALQAQRQAEVEQRRIQQEQATQLAELARLRSENARLKEHSNQTLSGSLDIGRHNQELQGQLNDLKKERLKMQAEIDDLKSQLNAPNPAHVADLKRLQDELTESERRREQAEMRQEEAENQALAQLNALRNENVALNQRNQSQANTINQLTTRLTQMSQISQNVPSSPVVTTIAPPPETLPDRLTAQEILDRMANLNLGGERLEEGAQKFFRDSYKSIFKESSDNLSPEHLRPFLKKVFSQRPQETEYAHQTMLMLMAFSDMLSMKNLPEREKLAKAIENKIPELVTFMQNRRILLKEAEKLIAQSATILENDVNHNNKNSRNKYLPFLKKHTAELHDLKKTWKNKYDPLIEDKIIQETTDKDQLLAACAKLYGKTNTLKEVLERLDIQIKLLKYHKITVQFENPNSKATYAMDEKTWNEDIFKEMNEEQWDKMKTDVYVKAIDPALSAMRQSTIKAFEPLSREKLEITPQFVQKSTQKPQIIGAFANKSHQNNLNLESKFIDDPSDLPDIRRQKQAAHKFDLAKNSLMLFRIMNKGNWPNSRIKMEIYPEDYQSAVDMKYALMVLGVSEDAIEIPVRHHLPATGIPSPEYKAPPFYSQKTSKKEIDCSKGHSLVLRDFIHALIDAHYTKMEEALKPGKTDYKRPTDVKLIADAVAEIQNVNWQDAVEAEKLLQNITSEVRKDVYVLPSKAPKLT